MLLFVVVLIKSWQGILAMRIASVDPIVIQGRLSMHISACSNAPIVPKQSSGVMGIACSAHSR